MYHTKPSHLPSPQLPLRHNNRYHPNPRRPRLGTLNPRQTSPKHLHSRHRSNPRHLDRPYSLRSSRKLHVLAKRLLARPSNARHYAGAHVPLHAGLPSNNSSTRYKNPQIIPTHPPEHPDVISAISRPRPSQHPLLPHFFHGSQFLDNTYLPPLLTTI